MPKNESLKSRQKCAEAFTGPLSSQAYFDLSDPFLLNFPYNRDGLCVRKTDAILILRSLTNDGIVFEMPEVSFSLVKDARLHIACEEKEITRQLIKIRNFFIVIILHF